MRNFLKRVVQCVAKQASDTKTARLMDRGDWRRCIGLNVKSELDDLEFISWIRETLGGDRISGLRRSERL